MTEEPSRSTPPSPASDAGQGLWQACVEQLAQDLPEQQFNTWIKPLVAQVAPDFSKVTVLVGNRFKLDWIRAQYAGRIAALLEGLYGQPVTLELALAQRESVARTYVRPAAPEQVSASGPAESPSASNDDAAAGAFR
ncbi:MAG TPA: DnaA N-terminal domain-containing protein, partial [Acidovorax sp.]|nr:DnaA N-terminal domain-containing protein [Acidovorax sp.]